MTKSYISKIAQLYDRNFPEEWIENQNWEGEEIEKESFISCNSLISTFQEESFILLAKSILSGEYLVRQLVPFIENLSQPKDYQPLESTSPLKKEIYKRYSNLDNELTAVLIHYRAFISSLEEKTDNNHKYIINAFSIDRDIASINPLYQILINYVIPLCRIDHFLSYNDKIIRNLILMKVDIEKNIQRYSERISEILKALIEKCSFLLKKLLYFKGKSEYILDFKSYTIENNDIVIKELQSLDNNFVLLHKEDSFLESDKVYLWQDSCHKKRAKFFQMILLMNKYKNHGNEEQINHLLEDFNRYYRSFNVKGNFDIFAIQTIKNYLYNCRFSYLLNHKSYTYNQLMEDFQYIESIQKTTGIQNFFPHYKVIGKLFDIIRADIKNNNTDKNIIEKELIKLENFIDNFQKKLTWSKECNFYPFQLPYRECLHKVGNILLFIPSSFNKPINYEDISNSLSQYKIELQALKREILFLDEKREIDKLKNEITNLKKTNIEIITGFTAAITFLFGCVNVFSENKNADIKLLVTNISVLGLFLLLFCSVIYLLTIPRNISFKEFLSNPKSVVSIILSIGCIYLIFNALL
jgi:hypothetical protein